MSERPIAFVTGGAGGIGAACCRALAKEGLRVGVGYRSSADAAKALGEEIGGFTVPGDIAVAEDVEKMIATIKDTAGRLDVLVNNAALNINGAFMMMPLEDIDKVRAVSRGTILLTKLAIRRFMFRQRSGRIINISSIVGHQGNAGQVP